MKESFWDKYGGTIKTTIIIIGYFIGVFFYLKSKGKLNFHEILEQIILSPFILMIGGMLIGFAFSLIRIAITYWKKSLLAIFAFGCITGLTLLVKHYIQIPKVKNKTSSLYTPKHNSHNSTSYNNTTKQLDFNQEFTHEDSMTIVYICNSPSAYAYHYNEYCGALNRCSYSIKELTRAEAKKRGRRPCGKCY